tara:strand:+ start:532 stop:3462 length:2931 start_codon:yes stop_codon:yes gene_type:complete
MKNPLQRIFRILTFTLLALSNIQLEAQTITLNENQYEFISGEWQLIGSNNLNFPVATNRIVIYYQSGANQRNIATFESNNGLKPLFKSKFGWTFYKLSTDADSGIFTLANSLLSDPIVSNVDVDTEGYYTQSPNDPLYVNQWYLENGNDHDIDMSDYWNLLQQAPGTTIISFLDSGFDINHEDLGTGSDGYHNLYLNPGEDAWSDPTDPSTGNGIDDDLNGLVDDWKGYDFVNNTNELMTDNFYHGTFTTGIALAKSNNNKGISGIASNWGPGGPVLLPCKIGGAFISSTAVAAGMEYSVDMNADVINMSFSIGNSMALETAIQYAKSEGVVLVAASGNNGSYVTISFPASHPDVIAVGGTDINDTKWVNANWGVNLDLAAPSENITSIQPSNTYNTSSGTSFSAPMVTATAALMKRQNPCLGPIQIREILNATAEKVGGYDYHPNNFPFYTKGKSYELGYGRLNVYQAVKAAQESVNPGLDLYMRDRYDDNGNDAGYVFTWDFDESPDIWTRNNPDGFDIQNQGVDEVLEWSSTDPFYTYVRVSNRGCQASDPSDQLKLYRSAASTNSGWPNSWDGTDLCGGLPCGALIGTQNIPVLNPGESVILEFAWSSSFFQNCLLARIESSQDPITVHPGDLAQDIYTNNNVSLQNLVIQNIVPGFQHLTAPHEEKYSTEVWVGNGDGNGSGEYEDLTFSVNEFASGSSLVDEAEVLLIFDASGWQMFGPSLTRNPGVRVIEPGVVEMQQDQVTVNSIWFDPGQRIPVVFAYNYLIDKVSDKTNYGFRITQKHSTPHATLGDHWTGNVHFSLIREPRQPFNADAGSDQNVNYGDPVRLNARNIGEDAYYNWYDENHNLLSQSSSYTFTGTQSGTYTLEVITKEDLYKDYDEVTLTVKQQFLKRISPNPTSGSTLSVDYRAKGASRASIQIIGAKGVILKTFNLDLENETVNLDISSLQSGSYGVVLVCDGTAVDSQTLIVN